LDEVGDGPFALIAERATLTTGLASRITAPLWNTRLAMNELSGETKEQIFCALGKAVVRIWSNLPQDVQHHLFEEAVMSQGESKRQQLAIYLHAEHQRTADALKARAIPTPDSPGG
jgi:hypothetical protein